MALVRLLLLLLFTCEFSFHTDEYDLERHISFIRQFWCVSTMLLLLLRIELIAVVFFVVVEIHTTTTMFKAISEKLSLNVGTFQKIMQLIVNAMDDLWHSEEVSSHRE